MVDEGDAWTMAGRSPDDARRTRWIYLWRPMIVGMRVYGIAVGVVWVLSATSLLTLFAVVASGVWLHLLLGGAAVLELALSGLTFVVMRRALRSGRLDT